MTMNFVSFTPTQGPVGGSVVFTITGLPADASPDNLFAFLSGDATVSVTDVNVDASTVTVTIEENAQSGDFAVACGSDGVQSPGIFTVTGSAGAPQITGMMPRQAAPGTRITLSGVNLTSISSVVIGTRAVVISTHTATLIQFNVPTNLTPGSYRVSGMSRQFGRVNCPFMLTITGTVEADSALGV
jgi:hypothetical protein